MKRLDELLAPEDPAIALVREVLEQGQCSYRLLPPSDGREKVLLSLQVTTRSTLGAVAFETGGILIDDGWLRFLGSGHPQLSRDIVSWNESHPGGHLLVADDAAGGFFSINAGQLGPDAGSVYYWAPDNLIWEPLGVGYTDFLKWSVSDQMSVFYKNLKWKSWREDLQTMSGDQCVTFYPFLWTREGSIENSSRRVIDVSEQFKLNTEFSQQLDR